MCLHGFDQSGHEQSVSRSPQLRREERQPGLAERRARCPAASRRPAASPRRAPAAPAPSTSLLPLVAASSGVDRDRHVVRLRPRALHLRASPRPSSIVDGEHLAAGGRRTRPRASRPPMSKLSSTAIQRFAHQLSPKRAALRLRLDAALRLARPRLGCAREPDRRGRRASLTPPPPPAAARTGRAAASFDSSVSQPSPVADDLRRRPPCLRLDHLVDLLLQRAGADELVDLHVARLADAEGAVGRLVLDRRVPPAVEVEDVVRAPSGSGPCRPP